MMQILPPRNGEHNGNKWFSNVEHPVGEIRGGTARPPYLGIGNKTLKAQLPSFFDVDVSLPEREMDVSCPPLRKHTNKRRININPSAKPWRYFFGIVLERR